MEQTLRLMRHARLGQAERALSSQSGSWRSPQRPVTRQLLGTNVFTPRFHRGTRTYAGTPSQITARTPKAPLRRAHIEPDPHSVSLDGLFVRVEAVYAVGFRCQTSRPHWAQ